MSLTLTDYEQRDQRSGPEYPPSMPQVVLYRRVFHIPIDKYNSDGDTFVPAKGDSVTLENVTSAAQGTPRVYDVSSPEIVQPRQLEQSPFARIVITYYTIRSYA
jgi:hypothetical protein